jgi:hypothetical protein
MCLLFTVGLMAAQVNMETKYKHTLIGRMQKGDSITYYQCHVINNASAPQKTVTLTEKHVIHKKDSAYILRYYISSFNIFPNRKFSGLKIKERDYWNFTFQSQKELTAKEVNFLAAMETSGKPTTEYDFAITKYTANQLIITNAKTHEQILPPKEWLVSEALKLKD